MVFRGIFMTCCLFVMIVTGQAQKKVIDEKAYGRWSDIESPSISRSGKWVTCWVKSFIRDKDDPAFYDPYFRVFNTSDGSFIDILGVLGATITDDEKYLFYKVASVSGGVPNKDSCIFLNLETHERETWKGDGSGHMLDKSNYLCREKRVSGVGNLYLTQYLYTDMRMRDSLRIDSVQNSYCYNNNRSIFYSKWEKDSTYSLWYGEIMGKRKCLNNQLSGIFVRYSIDRGNLKMTIYMASEKKYLKNPDLVYDFDLTTGKCRFVLDWKQVDFPAGYTSSSDLHVSGVKRNYVYANLQVVADTSKKVEKGKRGIDLEMWSWDDEVIPTMQRASQEKYTKKYVYNIQKKIWICLSDAPEKVIIGSGYYGDYALKMDFTPYQRMANWTESICGDLYLLNMQTGKESLIVKELWNTPIWSPNGEYAMAYKKDEKKWYALTGRTGEWKSISDDIPYPVCQEEYDCPGDPPPYGFMAWEDGGSKVVLRDRYDLWLVDLTGKQKATCLTSGYGRKYQHSLRLELWGENSFMHQFQSNTVNLKEDMLMKAIDEQTRAEVYYSLKSGGKPVKLTEGDFMYLFQRSSANGKKYIWRRMNYQEYPDLWCSDSDFSNPVRVTDVNAQQKEYRWGSAKMVQWNTLSGKPNQGVVYLPEDYDPAKKYPVVVCVYETYSGKINEHPLPKYSHSVINVPTYVSQGYVVFCPDVHYTVGHPGESCYDAVVSGVNMLIDKGIADKDRIGLQGHSWGGFQAAYLVTRTDLFQCVQIGAGIVNAVSGYTGLRGNGSPRMFMYELTQSRLGKTLWEGSDLYLENSPILLADKITAPILILHNDRDEAVPYSQGLDLFFAMRRLQKPAWLINYKNEGHVLKNSDVMQDWTIRMQQFFDYYLKGAQKPRWMEEGMKVGESKADLKYEFVK